MDKFVIRGVAKVTKSEPVQAETLQSLDAESTTAQNSISSTSSRNDEAAVTVSETNVDDAVTPKNNMLPSNSSQTASTQRSVKSLGRQFQAKWINTFPWINYNVENGVVTCSVCTEVVNSCAKLPLSSASSRDSETINTFVKHGFSSWNKALERFRSHQKSEVHRASIEIKAHTANG
jgi:hypothetical protein